MGPFLTLAFSVGTQALLLCFLHGNRGNGNWSCSKSKGHLSTRNNVRAAVLPPHSGTSLFIIRKEETWEVSPGFWDVWATLLHQLPLLVSPAGLA